MIFCSIMVFSRFFTFVFGAVTGVYVAQNYNGVPDVRECGMYYWGRIKEVEAERRRKNCEKNAVVVDGDGGVDDGDGCVDDGDRWNGV